VRGNVEALFLGPGADVMAALAASGAPGGDRRPARRNPRSLRERGQLLAKVGGVFRVQVDFIEFSVDTECDGLVGRPTS
jgi:hypothetical protein